MPRDETVQPGFKMVGVMTVLGERHGVVEQAGAVLEPRCHRLGDKSADESAQTKLSLIKTTAVIGHHHALDPIEAL